MGEQIDSLFNVYSMSQRGSLIIYLRTCNLRGNIWIIGLWIILPSLSPLFRFSKFLTLSIYSATLPFYFTNPLSRISPIPDPAPQQPGSPVSRLKLIDM